QLPLQRDAEDPDQEPARGGALRPRARLAVAAGAAPVRGADTGRRDPAAPYRPVQGAGLGGGAASTGVEAATTPRPARERADAAPVRGSGPVGGPARSRGAAPSTDPGGFRRSPSSPRAHRRRPSDSVRPAPGGRDACRAPVRKRAGAPAGAHDPRTVRRPPVRPCPALPAPRARTGPDGAGRAPGPLSSGA